MARGKTCRAGRRGSIAFILIMTFMWLGVYIGIPRCAHGGQGGEGSRFEKVRTIESLRSGISSRLPWYSGRMLAVSPRLFLREVYLPLAKAGVLKEVFMLVPAEVPLTEADLGELRTRLESAGIPESQRLAFRLVEGTILGEIGGVSCSIFPLSRIPDSRVLPHLLLLDPAFLLTLYRNEVRTPIVEIAWKLVLTLRSRGVLQGGEVLVADPPPTDDWSLRYGFLPGLLAEMIQFPSEFDKSLPGKWDALHRAESALFFLQYQEAARLYQEYLEGNPDDASACYKMAGIAARVGDDDAALHWLDLAVKSDPRYSPAFLDVASYFSRKQMFDAAARILEAGVARYPGDAAMSAALDELRARRGRFAPGLKKPEGDTR